MHSRIRIFACWLLLAALFAAGTECHAAKGRSLPESDSLLVSYYRACKDRLHEPEALAMCDTLFRRARSAGDLRMQTIALCLEVDHAYFRNDKERIVETVRRVQDFCRTHDKQALNYFYYFVWSSRLITYYVKQEKYNIALYETRRMLDEAQKERYTKGVGDCYRMLANLYLSQNNYRQAYDHFRLQTELFTRNGIDDVNLPTQYASMAQCALELDMPDSAAVALARADSLRPRSSYQRFTVCKAHALYCLHEEDYAGAGYYLAQAEGLFRNDPSMAGYKRGLYFLQREYYTAVGQYDKALDVALQAQREYDDLALQRDLGNIYFLRGDMRHSAERYRRYIRLSDSTRNSEVRSATADFSSLMEISRLQNEKRELRLENQHRRLRTIYIAVLLLSLALVLAAIAYVRTMRLNRRLKQSEAVVLAQNEHLTAVGEQLREAKERAELASNLKTEFIRSMSHEVRTPLNSIVGFSQVLASQFRDDPTMGEYASIIETSSRNFLRMVDDVLDISLLDRSEELPRPDFCEMNTLCQDCVAKMVPETTDRVALIFEPSEANPVVRTHAKRVGQVLLHLLHNAVKFTPEGEVILTYTCFTEQRLMRFTVADTGPGIPSDLQEHVFERFVKLDAFAQGTGLGLPVCRIIAEKLGGSLSIDAGYSGGCRMIFEIPYP